jgi:tyrosyl-tRNA synthetase
MAKMSFPKVYSNHSSSVKTRMDSGDGMSFAEFCYPILQAWDWWHMYESIGVQVQIGGSDQFGNIITGIEGVKHVAKTHPHNDYRVAEDEENWEPMGFTVPLMTTASGEKFGKSAGNAIWLNAEMTSPLDLYAVSFWSIIILAIQTEIS